jgi:hypothetical protein
LVPLGIFSIGYGGYTLLTSSHWEKLRHKAERLAGPNDGSEQWKLRREAHARRILMQEADSARFWRYLWGSLEISGAAYLVTKSHSAPALVTASVLGGLSVYNFFYPKAPERWVNSFIKSSEVGFVPGPGRAWALALRMSF